MRELSMTKVISLILVNSFLTLADARQESKNGKEPSPSDTVKKWIDAAAKKEMKAVAELASKATPKRSLKLIEEQGFLNYQGTVKIVHEEIKGDRAVVVYRLENPEAMFTAKIRYDVVVVVREDKQWKISEQGGGVLEPGEKP